MPENRRWLPKLLLESSLIVLSILLALAVDNWREARQDHRRVEQALASFQREIRANEAVLHRQLPYHERMQGKFWRIAEAKDPAEARARELVDFHGFEPPVLKDAAWRTCLATGVLAHLDYGTAEALSSLYTTQESLAAISKPEIVYQVGLLRHTDLRAGYSMATGYLTDLVVNERELLRLYESTRKRLDTRDQRPRGGRRGRS